MNDDKFTEQKIRVEVVKILKRLPISQLYLMDKKLDCIIRLVVIGFILQVVLYFTK